MVETCLSRFKGVVEVANYVCYVKYIDKKDEEMTNELVNDLYDMVKTNDNINKYDIQKIVNWHKHQVSPSMFKEEKFHLCYNAITDHFVFDEKDISDSYESPFVIRLNLDLAKRFHKEEFMNHFTDLYRESYYLLDIRYYGIEKKYYEVEYELILSEDALILKSEEPQYVSQLLNQYSLDQIVDLLGLKKEFKSLKYAVTTDGLFSGKIESVFPYSYKTVVEQLVDCYETSHCMFVNETFLKSHDIHLDNLLTPLNVPKLIIVLQESNYNYFNQQYDQHAGKIEYKDGNTILNINEHLFRETNGNLTYVLMMNDHYHISLNQLGPLYNDFPFITKCQNKSLSLFLNILDKYFNNKKSESYIDKLLLHAFVLGEEELNTNLNYYLANSLKQAQHTFFRFSQESRESMQFTELKKLLKAYDLAKQLSKLLVLNDKNKKLLLSDMENMIRKLDNLESIDEFITVKEEVLHVFNISSEFDQDLIQMNTLIQIKRDILVKQDINFILDTSVLIDEPDLLTKYFNGQNVVVHSIVKDELENYRTTNNINAVRAIRNINLLRNSEKTNFQYIPGEDMSGKVTAPIKVKVLDTLINQFLHSGVKPILVSNDFTYHENKRGNIVQLKHLPILFK